MGHGRALITIENEDIQSDIYHKIISQNLSVRETENVVKNYQESLKPKSGKTIKANPSFSVSEMDKKEIGTTLGTKVDIKIDAKGKGKITIPFKSESDFQRIIALIKG
jgi:ParB family chromosome partitioning protein